MVQRVGGRTNGGLGGGSHGGLGVAVFAGVVAIVGF